MRKITIIVGHPAADSYCEALGQAYLRGAQAAGHETKLLLLARMQFDAILREGYRREQALEPELEAAREAVLGCDHLVFIFPLWCGDMPAILKGLIERIFQRDLLRLQKEGGERHVLKGKSARIVMTMGMPGWLYRWYFGAHALKLIKRNILHFLGVRPVRSTIYGMIEAVGDAKRKQWLGEMEGLGRAGK